MGYWTGVVGLRLEADLVSIRVLGVLGSGFWDPSAGPWFFPFALVSSGGQDDRETPYAVVRGFCWRGGGVEVFFWLGSDGLDWIGFKSKMEALGRYG
jgi:hypothetical protein